MSPPEPLDLQAAADEIGVHYQTAYRWVRNGRLPATVINGRYWIEPDDLAEFIERRRQPTAAATPTAPSAKLLRSAAVKMHTALVTGDEATARDLARSVVGEGSSVADLIEQVIAPSLRQIGQAWHDGQLSIWVEHRASATTERILGDVAPHPRGRRRGTAVVAAVAGDRHSLATTMAAVTLRENNWHVHHLGADMPPEEIVDFVAHHDIDVAVLTVVNPDCAELARSTANALEQAGTPTIVGGPGRSLADLVQEADAAKR
jgi:MerR family transcriptional regulator, light-induced transcriptional regulator